MTTYSSMIDLSQLPMPTVVETLDVEAIYDAIRVDFLRIWNLKRAARPELPEITTLNLESDPLAVAFMAFAYRELYLRARINDAAKARFISSAHGADLDNLAADLNVERLVVEPATDTTDAVMESDERLRRRYLLKADAISGAGPRGAYLYHTLTAIPSLRDATAISNDPGHVIVTLMNSYDDPVPTGDQLFTVMKALSEDSVRPLTDRVSVLPPEVVEIDIVARLTVYPGPDENVVLAQAISTLQAWLQTTVMLGADIRTSAIISRLHVDGVLSVDLVSPTAGAVISDRQVVKVRTVDITVAGVDS